MNFFSNNLMNFLLSGAVISGFCPDNYAAGQRSTIEMIKNDFPNNIKWTAPWISRPSAILLGTNLPAPFFRKTFEVNSQLKNGKVYICGVGFYELYINGKKVGDHVLDPAPTVYSRRLRYLVYDVSNFLRPGQNVIGIILGNGLYNSSWNKWREYPRLSVALELDGKTVLQSDETWKVSSGPIIFDGVRNGETYDARLELHGWSSPGYDDVKWQSCARVSPPGGILEEQTMPPCKVMNTLEPVRSWTLDNGDRVYDLGQNIAGWARIAVQGDAGTEVTLRYAERLNKKNDIDQKRIAIFTKGRFQTDSYILKGQGEETWEPRFTYHGFQYIKVSAKGQLKKIKLEGRLVHTSFEDAGNFSCSDDCLNRLQQCFLWAYRSNFVGIPTDCPHREKAGWTADAHLVAEAGLFNYASATAYAQWLENFADVQRPSGQLPGIVPSCGGGLIWDSGPAWDSAIFLIPWYIYLYTGDLSPAKNCYEPMQRYIDFCSTMAHDNIVAFGLGDWLHPKQKSKHPWKPEPNDSVAPLDLICTAYYYEDCKLLAKFAGLLNKADDQQKYVLMSEEIRRAFNRKFYHGDGVYANGSQTAQALALYFGLVDDKEKVAVASRLAKVVETNGFKVDVGMLGSKCVLHALAENGYVEHAYKMLTQKAFPGWGYWLEKGANTLWEQWDGTESRNHPTFGDFSAWMYQYLAGINPDLDNPGFKHFMVKPYPVQGLNWVKAAYQSPYGKIISEWEKNNDEFVLKIQVPTGTTATVVLPDGATKNVGTGRHEFRSKYLGTVTK